MKRVNEYKKLFNVEGDLDLKVLKATYRSLVKEWHPDKFQAGDEKAIEAEQMSTTIIDAYHFLVSIAPETHEKNKEEYQETIDKGGITNIQHKGLVLEITFIDGTTFECFGVPRNVYLKLMNSDKQVRFAKRKIFGPYLFRKSKKAVAA
ncbi:MAG: DnaJ-class molecular chaperone [Cryomorphaceae bacterium]|jgi:DnaJ-class molecular chaperone